MHRRKYPSEGSDGDKLKNGENSYLRPPYRLSCVGIKKIGPRKVKRTSARSFQADLYLLRLFHGLFRDWIVTDARWDGLSTKGLRKLYIVWLGKSNFYNIVGLKYKLKKTNQHFSESKNNVLKIDDFT